MEILLTGASGYVGQIIRQYFADRCEVICLDLTTSGSGQIQCDLRDRAALERIAAELRPDIVIHAVGNKNIRICEDDPTAAYEVNCETVNNVATVFGGRARIIYISTDYVFDGSRGGYAEYDSPHPQTMYGKSKLSGELGGMEKGKGTFFVLRLSALYDAKAEFIRYLRQNLVKNIPVECFSNVKYSPTYVKDFLQVLDKLITYRGEERYFHACGEPVSRFEFARIFARTFGFDAGLIKEKLYSKDENLFLFPDLSLANEKSRGILNLKTTTHQDALLRIKQEGVNYGDL